jgi:hypothetical protein
MKTSLTFFLLFITSFLFAQNLVINPSFENYSTCPTDSCQISNADGWYNASMNASYFNSCGSNGYGMPYNKYGYQQASSGNGYSEFSLKADYATYIDNVGGQLTSPLIIGQRYFVSFNISLAGKSNNATDIMGIGFSTVQYSVPCESSSSHDPSLKFSSKQVITDSINWTKLNSSFIADSAYKYFVIGYIGWIDTIHIVRIDTANWFPYNIHYYLDDICVSTDSLTCLTTDIYENNLNNDFINIFPNPVTNELTLDYALTGKCFFELYNVIGAKRKTITIDIGSQTKKIDMTDIDNGLYFYSVVDKNGCRIKTGKLIVIK